MKPQPLHPSVYELIVDRIESVAQLDLLLLLMREPARVWTPDALAAELRTTEPLVSTQLQQLVQHNLALRTGQGFRYGADIVTHATVQELDRAYQSHPVAVVTLIYSKPNRTLKSFSDAFKLRKDDARPPEQPPKGGPGNG